VIFELDLDMVKVNYPGM